MRIVLTLAFVLVFASACFAQGFQGGSAPQAGGGFQGPVSQSGVQTVKEALSAWDDTAVVLTGRIVRREAGDHEKYLFQDQTGQIVVEIDDDLFMGRTVTPQTTIRLYGKVDKDMMKPVKIDVKNFEIQ